MFCSESGAFQGVSGLLLDYFLSRVDIELRVVGRLPDDCRSGVNYLLSHRTKPPCDRLQALWVTTLPRMTDGCSEAQLTASRMTLAFKRSQL